MTSRAKDYQRTRRTVNDLSRNEAKNNAERWSENEVEFLEAEWTTEAEDLVALAALLGRTVEACRQKHYDLSKEREHRAAESLKKVDKWSKGFTSLEDMGF